MKITKLQQSQNLKAEAKEGEVSKGQRMDRKKVHVTEEGNSSMYGSGRKRGSLIGLNSGEKQNTGDSFFIQRSSRPT